MKRIIDYQKKSITNSLKHDKDGIIKIISEHIKKIN